MITILPGSSQLLSGIYYAQIGIFLIFLFINLDFQTLLNYKLPIKQFRYKALTILLLVFLYSTFVMNFSNNGDIKSISKLLTYIVSFFLFFLYLPKIFINDTDKFELFINFFVIFAVITSLAGLLLLYSGITPDQLYAGYLTGIFGHPNTAGIVYSIAIPILIHKLIAKKINVWSFSALMMLFAFCLLFTFSRSSYVAVALSTLILVIHKSKKALIITVIILAVSVMTIFGDFFATKGGVSSISRLLLYFTAYDMITTNLNTFLWGYGVFHSLELFVVEKLFFGSLEMVVDPHNFILLLGIQFGMMVTILFITFSIWVMISSFVKRKSLSEPVRNYLTLSLTICISFLVQNLFEDIMVYPEYFVFLIYLIFLGFMFSSIGIKNQ